MIPGGSILSSFTMSDLISFDGLSKPLASAEQSLIGEDTFSFMKQAPEDAKKEMQSVSSAMKKPMDDLKKDMQSVSNVLKTRHDTVKNAISNIR